jgi:hypothetical protein
MGLVPQLVIFVSLILVLSALRTRLVYELTGSSLLLFRTTKPGLYLFSILVLPGTILHELSHWLTAELLGVRTGAITILPSLSGQTKEEQLGSVATAKTDPLRGFLIGIAPLLTGLLALVILGQLKFSLLTAYGIMVVGNSMLISRADRATWPVVIVLALLATIVLWRYNLALPSNLINSSISIFSQLNWVLGLTAGVNLVMICVSLLLRRGIEGITRQRIVPNKKGTTL